MVVSSRGDGDGGDVCAEAGRDSGCRLVSTQFNMSIGDALKLRPSRLCGLIE